MEYSLPAGIFVEMSNEFDGWTEEDFNKEIRRLRACIKELESKKMTRVDYEEVLLTIPEDELDDDDIMHDPDIQEMVKNGEHTCHMFDAHCQACEDDEEDEDDITLAELKEQLEDNMTLAEIQQQLDKVEAAKKRLETIRLKKEKKEEEPFGPYDWDI